jgi:hypothetical protein
MHAQDLLLNERRQWHELKHLIDLLVDTVRVHDIL